MPTSVIRGDHWPRRLQEWLDMPPADTAQWMEQHTQLLKSDAYSRVGLLRLQEELCCLKLYRQKSALQGWLFRRGRGRPVHCFDIAVQLRAAHVPVPQPRACLLVPGGMLLLSEGLTDAVDLHKLWQSGQEKERCRRLLAGAGTTLARLHRAGFAHGDCKWRNLLWSGGQWRLVDLDAAGRAPPGAGKQARDLARFTLDAEEHGLEHGLYEHFLDTYLQGVAQSREDTIGRLLPPLRKLRARHLARYGERGHRLL